MAITQEMIDRINELAKKKKADTTRLVKCTPKVGQIKFNLGGAFFYVYILK